VVIEKIIQSNTGTVFAVEFVGKNVACVCRLQMVLGVDDVHAAVDVDCLSVSRVASRLLQHCVNNERM